MTDIYATREFAGSTSAPPVNPVLSITTEGSVEITSKVTYVNATMALTGVPGQADIFDTLRIRGRGNLTWVQPKKPFKLKLDNSQPMLGLPTSKDWALLANWFDHAALHTPLADQIGYLSPGLAWTPHYGFVDVFLNNVYQGNYQLIESVTVAATRVNFTKATGTSGLALTGGYLLEVSNTAQDDDPSFTTTHGTRVLYDDPDGTVTQQATYISTWMQSFEDVLYGSGFADPTTGYRAWIDVPSFISWYLVEELAKNDQGGMQTSAKCYKTRDIDGSTPGKLFMGPLWDFDESFGVTNRGVEASTGFAARPDGGWFDRLFEDPTFAAEVVTAWTALKTAITGAGGINKLIDRAVSRTASPQIRDGGKWEYDPDWAATSSALKAWIAARIAWLDAQYVAAPATGYAVEVAADNPISHWRLGETSGTTAADVKGVNAGTYVGGVTLGTTGLTTDGNKAITLDGTDDHVVVKSSGPIISGLANWTIEFIAKPIDGSRIAYGERGSSGLDILEIEVKSLTSLTYRDHAGNINQPAVTTSSLFDGNAHHIAITKSGTSVKFYEDGVQNGSATLTATDTFGEATTQSWIGADPTGAQYFHGVIDEVALYNTALSGARIAAHNAAR